MTDLNRDLSHLFFVTKMKWFKSQWWSHLPMKNYNKQKQVYCFIVLFNLFNDWFYSHWVQLTMLERFSTILAISYLNKKTDFFKKNHDFFPTLHVHNEKSVNTYSIWHVHQTWVTLKNFCNRRMLCSDPGPTHIPCSLHHTQQFIDVDCGRPSFSQSGLQIHMPIRLSIMLHIGAVHYQYITL